ncbi:hypothetical protein MP228_008852 [Amoeboaphelidium protococcarum]|nr:hypothetical protein MP228_008852 [Amoeboaphelidium protococcarum]
MQQISTFTDLTKSVLKDLTPLCLGLFSSSRELNDFLMQEHGALVGHHTVVLCNCVTNVPNVLQQQNEENSTKEHGSMEVRSCHSNSSGENDTSDYKLYQLVSDQY